MLERIPFEERALAPAPRGTDLPLPPDPVSAPEAVAAGFQLENEISNLVSYLGQDEFPANPEFDPVAFGADRPLFQEFPEVLAVTNSEDEFLAKEMRLRDQQENMRLMGSRPGFGFIGAAAGAIASPIILVPLTGQARGAKGVGQAFALAAGAATAQEATLLGLQETRTQRDFVTGVTFGTVLGGLLGSAAVGLKGRQLRALERNVAAKEAQGELVVQRVREDGTREDIVVRTVNDERATAQDELVTALEEFSADVPVTARQEAGIRALGIETPEAALRLLGETEEFPVESLARFLEAQKAEVAVAPAQRQLNLPSFDSDTPRPSVKNDVTFTRRSDPDPDLPGRSVRQIIATQEGKTVGALEVEEKLTPAGKPTNELAVYNSSLSPELRGEGLGLEMYEELIQEAQKTEKIIVSDNAVSASAVRVYEALARRGYTVEKNQTAKTTNANGRGDKGRLITEDEGPVFKVTDSPARSADEIQAAQAAEAATADAQRAIDERIERLRNPDAELQAEIRDGTPPDELQGAPDRTPTGASAGAASVRNVPKGLAGKSFGRKPFVEALAALNPLTRSLDSRFASVRYWAARFQIPNVHLDFGDPTAAARSVAEDGTIQARTLTHQRQAVDFIQTHDAAYAEHLYGPGAANRLGAKGMAAIKGRFAVPEGKMSFKEYEQTVYDLTNTGGEHPDAAVMKSAKALRKFWDYFRDVADDYYAERQFVDGDEAQPLFVPFEGDATGAREFAKHTADAGEIIERQDEFLREVAEWAERVEREAFEASWARFNRTQQKNDQMLRLLALDEGEAKQLFDKAEGEIASIEAEPAWQRGKQQLADLRKQLRASGADEKTVRAEARALEENLGPEFADLAARRQDLVADRRVLSEIGANATEQQQRLLADIAKLEQQQENQLDQVINAALRAQQKLARTSDDVLDAEFDKLRQRLKREISAYNKHANAVEELEGQDDFVRAAAKEELAQKADERIKKVFARIEKAEGLDREALRADIEQVVTLSKDKATRLNGRRAVRAERLRERAAALSPEEKARFREEETKRVQDRRMELRQTFNAKWTDRGAVELDLDAGTANFEPQAQDDALTLFNKLTGNEGRISGLDILGGARGSQLARVWNMPYEQKKKWLIRKPEFNARSYMHSMAPDLEIYRATGSSNGARMFNEMRAEIDAERTRLANSEFKSEKAQRNAMNKFDKQARQAQEDLQALVERHRHQRGTAKNAEGLLHRAGRAARNVNTYRFMGTVTLSSSPDLARPVFRFGLMSTFKNAWLPLVTDLQRVKLTRAAARRFAIAVDPVLHNRANQIADAGENVSPGRRRAGTAAGRGAQNTEKALEVLANRTGQVGLFDRWTAEMKQIANSVTLSEVSHALRLVNEGGSGKELKRAQEMLADMSIGENMQRRIWDQYKLQGGSDEFEDGVRIPNTDTWEDQQAVRALGAGINNIVDDLIITPGLDRPLWMDDNEAFRMVAQFRSFTFTATTRIMLSTLQKPDAAALQGIMFSTGLGAMSYAGWLATSGRGEELADAPMERWIYEAVDRSGNLGVLSEGMRVGEQIPALNDFAIFGGEGRSTRRADSVMAQALGPTYDLATRLTRVVQGIDEPTQSTLHQARVALMPYQNVFWLRTTLDKVEEAAAEGLNLPERRGE